MNQTVPSESHPEAKPPVSERKATANRANAQRSTGPRTPAGKARASLNALRHGILARAAFNPVIEGEERRAEFDALVVGLAQEYQPRTITEHMTVQQLAGCYWRLAKVWTYETESAWRARAGLVMPLEEVAEWGQSEDQLLIIRDRVMQKQKAFFPAEELGRPAIPGGATARTILRYQGAINTMLTRCLTILERRRKERMAADAELEELDYLNEATAEVDNAEDPDAPSPEAETQERTQKAVAEASVSSKHEVKSPAAGPATAPIAHPYGRETQ